MAVGLLCVVAEDSGAIFVSGTYSADDLDGFSTSGSGRLDMNGGTVDGGTFSLGSTVNSQVTGFVTFDGVTIDGELEIFFGQILVKNGLELNGTIRLTRTSFSSNDSIRFAGTQALGGTGEVVFATNQSTNRLSIDSGSTLTIGEDITIRGQGGTISGTFVNQGTIASDESGTISLSGTDWINEGTIEATASGRISGSGTLTNSGLFSVTFDGVFSVSNDFIQDENGEIRVEIDSTSEFGDLAISGAATLDGTLTVVFTGSASVVAGDSFAVVTYAERTGSFATTATEGLHAALMATINEEDTETSVDLS